MSKKFDQKAYMKEYRAKNKEKLKKKYKEYYLKNKEKVKALNKEWADNNREHLRTYQKEWKAKNPEKVKANRKRCEEWTKSYQKQWRENNKEYCKEYNKKYRANQKDGYHRVYLLEDYNYVGVTDYIKHRFSQHKTEHNRDCTNHRILYKTKDRDEAEELEALLHDIGYEGRHNFKNKTRVII